VGESKELLERVVDTFKTVASDLGAFYAAAYVERNVRVGRSRTLSYDRDSDNLAARWPKGPWWLGIPPIPVWISWFGSSYATLVRDSVGDLGTEASPGLMVRLGAEPLDTDAARRLMPALPQSLLARLRLSPAELRLEPGDGLLRFIDARPARTIPSLDG
jgi:hypothetical protein